MSTARSTSAAPNSNAHTVIVSSGTDLAPPEQVPLVDADFVDEAQARSLREPTAGTDAQGRLLPQWAPADESHHAVAPPRSKKKSVVVS